MIIETTDSPWQSQYRTNLYENRQNEQIQMVAATFFQFIFLAIDDDRRDLLIHEYQNDTEQCRKECHEPPPN